MNTLIIFVIVCLLLFLIMTIPFTNNSLYCRIYERKDWLLWENFLKSAYDFEFKEIGKEGYIFTLNDRFGNERYKSIVWKENGLSSIHYETDCLLCIFDKKHSKKMADILMKKIGK